MHLTFASTMKPHSEAVLYHYKTAHVHRVGFSRILLSLWTFSRFHCEVQQTTNELLFSTLNAQEYSCVARVVFCNTISTALHNNVKN